MGLLYPRIFVYQFLLLMLVIWTLPVWLVFLVAMPKLRAGFLEKLGVLPPSTKQQLRGLDRSRPVVWVHAVSVGEFLGVHSLIEALLVHRVQVVLSVTTLTGRRLADEKLAGRCPILYFPFDVFWAVQNAVRFIRPDLVLLMETELWPYFIWKVGRRVSTGLWLINGRLSEKSFRGYQKLSAVFSPILRMMDHAWMQSRADASRFRQLLGQPPLQTEISVMGNLKFDMPFKEDAAEKIATLKRIYNFPPEAVVLTIASTHEGEELPILRLLYKLQRDFPELRIILAPRHPERSGHVSKLLREETFQFRLRSSLSEEAPNTERMVLVDTIGELKYLYHISSIAIVGGSFLPHLNGHNILEPIMAGTPVLFGPHMSSFREVVETVKNYQAGIEVSQIERLKRELTYLITNPQACEALTKASYQLVQDHQGQRARLVEAILKQLNWH